MTSRGYPNTGYRRLRADSRGIRGFQDAMPVRAFVGNPADYRSRHPVTKPMRGVPPMRPSMRVARTALRGLSRLTRNPWLQVAELALEAIPDLLPGQDGQEGQPLSYDFTGWTQTCFNAGIVPAVYHGQQFACRINGTQLESFFDAWPTGLAPPAAGNYWVTLTAPKRPHSSGDPGFINYDTAEIWRRSELDGVPPPVEIPQVHPKPAVPFPNPASETLSPTLPAIDPMSLPIGQPMPAPFRIPYRYLPLRQPNPYRHPQEQPQRGNEPPTPPGVIAPPVEVPENPAGPTIIIKPRVPFLRFRTRGLKRREELDLGDPWDTLNFPKEDVDVETQTQTQRLTKFPSRVTARTREKKFVARIGNQMVRAVISNVTEVGDFVDAIWNAIPRDAKRLPVKGQQRGMHEKMVDIYNSWDAIDWTKAWKTILQDQVEDYVLGRLGKGLANQARVNPYYNRAVGFQTGMKFWPRVPPTIT